MWNKVPLTDAEIAGKLRRMKKMRLYADEDIGDDAVEYLRKAKVNVMTVREQGHQGKQDDFHLGQAFRLKRVILTRNGKDFRRFPFQQLYGLIVMEGKLTSADSYLNTLNNIIFDFVPHADLFLRSKIFISENHLTVRHVRAGKEVKLMYQLIQHTNQWTRVLGLVSPT